MNLHAVNRAVDRLAGNAVVPAIAPALEAGRSRLVEAVYRAIIENVPAFTESANPDVLPTLREHVEDHVDSVTALLARDAPAHPGFIVAFAEANAERHFPLDALLDACRCLQRELSTRLRDEALGCADPSAQVRRVVAAVADFVAEYAGAASAELTNAYVRHTRRLAAAEGDRRTALLNTLLDGYDESDRQAAELLRRAGYLEQRQAYCVVAARAANASEMGSPARAQRMADAIAETIAAKSIRVIAGLRDNLVIAVTSATRRVSGWTAPQSQLAGRVRDALLPIGPAALVGLSTDVPSTSHIPRAVAEARFALGFASVSDRIYPYARISLRQLVVTHARDAVRPALPEWSETLAAADDKARGKLSATLRAYADADMNVLETAKRLGIHPNTVYARMQRIEDATGLSPLRYHPLTEMLLALECR